MEPLKYKIIKTERQYGQYCNMLEQLHEEGSKSKQKAEEIELLSFLIKKWDDEHNTFTDVDPIVLLKGLMAEHKLKAKDLTDILGVSKGLVSDILSYKKGLSKEIIRTLATHFKVAQEAFNKPYLNSITEKETKKPSAVKKLSGMLKNEIPHNKDLKELKADYLKQKHSL